MDNIASFSGLVSGVQWRDLVDQIMAVEHQPADRLQSQIDLAKQRSSAWSDFTSRIQALKDAAAAVSGSSFLSYKGSISGVASGSVSPLSVTVGSGATAGSYGVNVLALASAEKLGGAVFSSNSDALGISGELVVNGRSVAVQSTDTLATVAQRFNAVNTGSSASGVTASVLKTSTGAYRLVLTSNDTGADGIDLVDGEAGVLRSLGLLDDSVAIKTATSDGAASDVFTDADTAVATLRSLSSPPASADVDMGGVSVTVDLSTMTLTDIADAINTAAGIAGKAVSASVVDDASGSGQRLEIAGTTSFTDNNRILEVLGVLEGGRSAVAQEVTGSALSASGGGAATTSTLLTDLAPASGSGSLNAGDTITIAGTRGDGTSVSISYTVGAADTMQTLLDRINSATDGFGSGSRTADATLDASGVITLTDGTSGESRLSLSMSAQAADGSTFDFGDFSTSQTGRSRVIVAGADAEIEVDGTYLKRSSNSITDAVDGVTLSLTATTSSAVTVTVARDADATAAKAKALVDAYNALSDFVTTQMTAPAEGATAPPLYGNAVLRGFRTDLKNAMQTIVATAISGDYNRLGVLGLDIAKNGHFNFDAAKLKDALAADPTAVQRLFNLYTSGSVSTLKYVTSSDKTDSGTYAVNITQAATQASVSGSVLGDVWTYTGAADTLSVRDTVTDRTYAVDLSGKTLAEIAAALNTEFDTAQAHEIASTTTLYGDASQTPAGTSTAWTDLYDAGGASLGITDGDVISISGTRGNGTSFLEELTIDTSSGTLDDLRAAVQDAVGSDATVSFENGILTVTADETGSSNLSLTLGYTGAGSLSFGSVDVVTQGRSAADITASADGGQLTLTHNAYGSSLGFEVSYAGGDGEAQLGLAAGTYAGLDVAGTIGGYDASGDGQVLTGADDTPIEGLGISYSGQGLGAVGDFDFSRGVGAAVSLAAAALLPGGDRAIEDITQRLDDSTQRLNDRIDQIEKRLELRRDDLIRRFTAMEEAMAQSQTQLSWLTAQINQFSQSSK